MTSQVERTPLPYPQYYILLCVRFIEPISFTLIFPFVYFMVDDFNVAKDPKEIAYYAGFISSAFAVGEFLSGVPWGMISDRIGRKPSILFGLFGTMVTMILFGLSKSLWWAIITRFFSGVLNGNIGVVKTVASELTDRSNRALGFSYMAMLFTAGSIVGPALGGFLSNPVKNIPFIFGGNKFFSEYPYFLPCLLSSSLCFIGFIFIFIFLDETLNKPVIQPDSQISSDPSSDPTINDSFSMKETIKNNDEINFPSESEDKGPSSSISKGTWYVIISYIGLSLVSVMLDELFPFWAATSIEYGGLGYLSPDIGLLVTIMGFILIFIQLFLYPSLQRRISTLKLYRFSLICFIPVICSLPLISLLISRGFKRLSWWVLIILMSIRFFCAALGFTSYNILLPESCRNKNILGKVNGVAQALGSLMRGIGPSLCGILWSWSLSNNLGFPFDYHLTFFVIALVSLITFFLVNIIKPSTLIF